MFQMDHNVYLCVVCVTCTLIFSVPCVGMMKKINSKTTAIYSTLLIHKTSINFKSNMKTAWPHINL